MEVPVQVVCLAGVAAGFHLAGLDVMECGSVDAGVRRLSEAIASAEAKLFLAQESVYDGLSPETRARLGRRPWPMVVPFPDPSWEALPEPEAYIIELLRRAIGYRVRLR